MNIYMCWAFPIFIPILVAHTFAQSGRLGTSWFVSIRSPSGFHPVSIRHAPAVEASPFRREEFIELIERMELRVCIFIKMVYYLLLM